MRNMDENGLKLCRLQAELYADSLNKTDCSSSIFIRRFMNSDVAKRMDSGSFLFESCDKNGIFEEIEIEYGNSSYGKEKYSASELYWIGYIYRYWSYTYDKSSKQVYSIIKPKELKNLYYPYHSLDPSMAIERILEAKGLSEISLTDKGVKIMRGILQKRNLSSNRGK